MQQKNRHRGDIVLNLAQVYKQKQHSVEEAVNVIPPGTDIITPLIAGEPYGLMKQLEKQETLESNRLFQMLTTHDVLNVDPKKLQIISLFLGASERQAFKKGDIDLLPNHFSDIPNLLKEITRNPIVMATVSPMDERGFFSLGTNCDHTAAMLPHSKIILEVNESMPRTFGENQVHISQVEALIEKNHPLPEAPTMKLTEKDKRIGEHVASLIDHGDTIQIGFGSIPNAIMDHLKAYRNLSIHTEMVPEKIIDLYEHGAVTNENNPFQKGKTTATFAYGSRKLYDFLHENPDIYMLPVNKTNHISYLQSVKNLVTINAAIELDFLGQVNAEMVNNTYWSSTGGQADFQIASHISVGGRGITCLHATAKNDTISKIVPTLQAGTPVSTSKNDVDYVVTEYGIAKLRGKTIRERAKALIHIAHPTFREELMFTAKKMGYV